MAKPAVSDAVVTSTDFYPTILEMAGMDLRPDLHMDGKSLVPLLKNETRKIHDAAFFHYPHRSNQKSRPSSAIRKGDHKLIVFFEDGRRELYDLSQDIGENENLAEKMPELTDSLYAEMKDWWKEVDARFPKGFVAD